MNAVLNSNSSSAIISAVDSVDVKFNPFVYQYSKKNQLNSGLVPAHVRSTVRSNPQSTMAFNSATDFKVIRSSMLENAVLRLEIALSGSSTTNDCDVAGSFFNEIVESAQLISSGRVIQETKAFGRMCKISSRPRDVRENLESALQLTNGDKTLAGGSSVVAYIPLMFSCFESPELMYNTSFTESLRIRIRLKSVEDLMKSGETNNLSLTQAGCYIQQVHRTLPSALEQSQIAENMADTDALVRVQYGLVEESTTTNLSSGTELFHIVNSNRSFTKIYFAVDDIADNEDTGKHLELETIKIECNGGLLMELDADMLGFLLVPAMDRANEPYGYGGYSDTSFDATRNIYCYDLGFTQDLGHSTNLNSLREINQFKITATLPSAQSGNHRLRVCLVSPELESIASASGKITTSLSS